MGVSKRFLKGRLITFLESGEFSDTILIVGKEDKKIKVHKLLLMTSEYFHKKLKQFFGRPIQPAVTVELAALDLNLNTDNTRTAPSPAILVSKSDDPDFELEIRIPCLEPDEMDLYLQFLYAGGQHLSLVDVSFEDAVHLFRAGKAFEDSRLLADCRSIFDISLSAKIKNLFTAFELAVEFDELDLKRKSLEFICRDALVLVNNPAFLQLKPECLAVLLETDELQVESELQLFQAVVKWGHEECKRQNLNCEDQADLKFTLEPLIKHLRFTMMKPEEFSREVPRTKVISSDDIVEVLVYFSRPDDEREKTDSVGGFTTRARKYVNVRFVNSAHQDRTHPLPKTPDPVSSTSVVPAKEHQSFSNASFFEIGTTKVGFGDSLNKPTFGSSSAFPFVTKATFCTEPSFRPSTIDGIQGTTLKFTPLSGTDTMIKGKLETPINIRHQCITCMSAYENKSLEELRTEDYKIGRKGRNSAALFGPTFRNPNGMSTTQSFFGQTTSFQSPSAFTFSKPPTESGLFGVKSLASPAPVHTASGFPSLTSTNIGESVVGTVKAASITFGSINPFLFEKSAESSPTPPTNKSSVSAPTTKSPNPTLEGREVPVATTTKQFNSGKSPAPSSTTALATRTARRIIRKSKSCSDKLQRNED